MSEEKKIYCHNCGDAQDSIATYCTNCGNKLEKADPAVGTENNQVMEETSVVDTEVSQSGFPDENPVVVDEPVPQDFDYQNNTLVQNTTDANYDTYNYQPIPEPVTEKKGNIGFSIASMVCGIFSILCCCFWWLGIILSIVAIVLGIVAIKNKYDGKGMAIAGIVTGSIAIVLLILVFAIAGFSLMTYLFSEFY